MGPGRVPRGTRGRSPLVSKFDRPRESERSVSDTHIPDSRRDDRRRRHEPMPDVVHHHAEPLDRPHAQQRHVSRLGEHHFVDRFKSFASDDRVPGLPRDQLLRRGRETPFAYRRNPDTGQQIPWQPGEFRTRVDDGRETPLKRFASVPESVPGRPPDASRIASRVACGPSDRLASDEEFLT